MPDLLAGALPGGARTRVGEWGVRSIGWFLPDRQRGRVELLRTQIYVVFSLLVAANAALFTVLHHVHHLPGTSRAVVNVLIVVCVASTTFPFLLRAGIPLRVLGPTFMVFFAAALVGIMAFDGGLASGAVFWMAMAPLAAGFIGGARLGWRMAVVSVSVGAAMYGASVAGVTFSRALSPADAEMHFVLNFISAAFLTAVLAALYEGPMRQHSRELSMQLAAANEGLRAELAERARAQAAAEAGNRAKDALLSNMSHEFRTPLTAILGFTDVLLDEVEDTHRPFLQSVDRGAKRLLSTLNGVLELAWVESSEATLRRVPVDLVPLVQQAASAVRPQADRRGLTVDVEVEPAVASVDAGALGRILWALLDNAVRFTEEGGVMIVVREDGPWATVAISDTGVGMAPELIPHAVEPFRQMSEGDGRSHEGAGLGLTVASRLAERMGGALGIESALGCGTTVTVRVPSARSATVAPHGDGEDLDAAGLPVVLSPMARAVSSPSGGATSRGL